MAHIKPCSKMSVLQSSLELTSLVIVLYLPQSPILRSYPSALPPGLPTNMTVVTESREGAPMVVISVHPKQQQFVSYINN